MASGDFRLARGALADAADAVAADLRRAFECSVGVAALFRELAFAHCSDPQLEGRALRRANHIGLRFLHLAMTWFTYASTSGAGGGQARVGGSAWPVSAQELNDDLMAVSDALRSTGAPGHEAALAGWHVPHDYRRPELRIAIVSLCAYPPEHALPACSASNHGLYAERHGYAYLLEREAIDATRPPAWGKVKVVERAIHSGHWDWVVWVDCDTYFMNMSVTVESILFAHAGRSLFGAGMRGAHLEQRTWGSHGEQPELEPQVHFIVSEDAALLNTGVFFARCTGWVAGLLTRVWGGEDSPWTWHPWWENAAFMWEFLKENARSFAGEDHAAWARTAKLTGEGELEGIYPGQVRVALQSHFNSYHPITAGSLHDTWEEGKFVLAFSGIASATSPSEAQGLYKAYYWLACRLNGLEGRCIVVNEA